MAIGLILYTGRQALIMSVLADLTHGYWKVRIPWIQRKAGHWPLQHQRGPIEVLQNLQLDCYKL